MKIHKHDLATLLMLWPLLGGWEEQRQVNIYICVGVEEGEHASK